MVTATPLSDLNATVLVLHTVASQTAITPPMTSGCCCPISGSAATSVRCCSCHLPDESMRTIMLPWFPAAACWLCYHCQGVIT